MSSDTNSHEHKAGENFALREIAIALGISGRSYHAVKKEIARLRAAEGVVGRQPGVMVTLSGTSMPLLPRKVCGR